MSDIRESWTRSTIGMDWFSDDRTLVAEASTLRLNGFPRYLRVQSHKTGAIQVFVYDQATAEANDFWDGELAEYIPEDVAFRNVVKKLVILND
jgi:hypothetical protein